MSRRSLAVAALLALLAAGVFGEAGAFGFLEEYDDGQYVVANPRVLAGLTPGGVAWAFTSVGHASNWHPLTWLSHMLDVQLFGLRAGAHHLVSVALHAANAALLFLVLRAMTGALRPAAFASALFAAHPLRAESVVWIAERKDVLSTLLFLLALGAWLRYSRRPGAGRYAAVAAAMALGLLAKPMLVTLPLVLLLLDVWPLGRARPGAAGWPAALGRLALEKLPLLALSAASAALTVVAQRRGGSVADLALLPAAERVAAAAKACVAYLRLTGWPAGLSPFYPYERVAPLSAPALLSLAAVAALTALALAAWRRRPWFAAGWLWFLGTLVPVAGFVQVGAQAFADRYTYVPTIGLFVALAWGVRGPLRRRALPRALAAVVAAGAVIAVAALGVAARAQAGYWRDGVTLFARAVDLDPRNWVAHHNLGVALRRRGRDEEALAHLRRAVQLRPEFPDTHYNLAVLLADRGDLEAAAREYREALRYRPGAVQPLVNLAVLLSRKGDVEGALALLEQAVGLYPANPVARTNLGVELRKKRRDDEAFAHFSRVVAATPAYAEARYNLGVMLAERGRTAEAAAEYRETIRLAPGHQEATCNLGAILYERGDLEGAIALFREAVRLDPRDPVARRNLEAALARRAAGAGR